LIIFFLPPFFFISFILQKVLYKAKTTPKTATSTCTKNNEKYNLMKEYHKDAKNGTMFFCQAFVKHRSNQQIKRRQKQCQHWNNEKHNNLPIAMEEHCNNAKTCIETNKITNK
jgi:hypothetical protein